MSNPKNYGFDHNGQRWLHLQAKTEEEVYQLHAGRDLVAQAWPKDTDENQFFTLSTKDYKSQVWHQKTIPQLENVLDDGNAHADQYMEAVIEHGPPKRLPPHLYKEQRGEHTWVISSKAGRGALLSEAIKNEKGETIVAMAHIDEGGSDPAYYVDTLHPKLGESAYLYRTHNLQAAYRDCEEKADQYHTLEKVGYEWKLEDEEHPHGYALENSEGSAIAIIYPNDESRTMEASSNAVLEVKTNETNDWKVIGWNLDLSEALDRGNRQATSFLKGEVEKEFSPDFSGESLTKTPDLDQEPSEDIEIDI